MGGGGVCSYSIGWGGSGFRGSSRAVSIRGAGVGSPGGGRGGVAVALAGGGGGDAEDSADVGPGGAVAASGVDLFANPHLGLRDEAGEEVELDGGVEVFHETPVGQGDDGVVHDQVGVEVDLGVGRGGVTHEVVHGPHRLVVLSVAGGAVFGLAARLAARR